MMTDDLNPLKLFTTPWFWSAFTAWIVAQTIKMTTGFIKTGKIDFHYLLSTGGMPSAHSATVCALATSVGLNAGFQSQVFMSIFIMALIVMFDASTVRRAAGLQARLLNDMVQELFKEHRFSERKLVELLGHTRREVFIGLLLGVGMAVLVNAIMGNGHP